MAARRVWDIDITTIWPKLALERMIRYVAENRHENCCGVGKRQSVHDT
jgi:hypothetical protein